MKKSNIIHNVSYVFVCFTLNVEGFCCVVYYIVVRIRRTKSLCVVKFLDLRATIIIIKRTKI